MRSQIAFVLLGCVLGVASLGAMRKSDQDPVGALLAQLRSDDPEERYRASQVLEHNHAHVVAVATQIAASRRDDYERERASARFAARLLTKYYSRNSLPMLVRNVDYFQETFGFEGTPFDGFPCASALADIGPSAVPAILSHLRTSPPEEVSDRAIYLFARVMDTGRSITGAHGRDITGVDEEILALRRAGNSEPAPRHPNLRRLLNELERIAAQQGVQVE